MRGIYKKTEGAKRAQKEEIPGKYRIIKKAQDASHSTPMHKDNADS